MLQALGQDPEALGPGLGAGEENHGPELLLAIGLFEKSLAMEKDVALHLSQELAVPSLDSGLDHLQTKGPAFARVRIGQGEGAVRHEVAVATAASLAPESDLAPEAGLAFH